jgi:hypothetical protein
MRLTVVRVGDDDPNSHMYIYSWEPTFLSRGDVHSPLFLHFCPKGCDGQDAVRQHHRPHHSDVLS